MKKICSKCGQEKDISCFYKRKGYKDGIQSQCKECVKTWNNQYNKEYRKENPLYFKQYRQEHKEEARKHKKQYRQEHKEGIKEYSKHYRQNHKEGVKQSRMRYYKKHHQELLLYYRIHNKKYRETEKARKVRKEYCAKPKNRLAAAMRSGVSMSLKGNKKGRGWEALVGYTLQDLKRHLEKQFQFGMTWDNYGEWHIDHRIPITAFNFKEPEHIDFKQCWALENLQPMWASENMSKNASLQRHFQPNLKLKFG